MSAQQSSKPQRWTGPVSVSDVGGFVTIGDYLSMEDKLHAENDQLRAELAKLRAKMDGVQKKDSTVELYTPQDGEIVQRYAVVPCRCADCNELGSDVLCRNCVDLRCTSASADGWPADSRSAIDLAIEIVETERDCRDLSEDQRREYRRCAVVLRKIRKLVQPTRRRKTNVQQ